MSTWQLNMSIAPNNHSFCRCFLNDPPESRYTGCFQSPFFCNITLDERWLFTRAFGIIRSYFMVASSSEVTLTPCRSTVCHSVFQLKATFFHPGYQMDGIIYTWRAMRATRHRIGICNIDTPTLSGPKSDTSMIHEFKE